MSATLHLGIRSRRRGRRGDAPFFCGAPVGAATAAILGLACGEAEPRSPTVERDSAGVRIVESAAPAWAEGEEWTVGFEPDLDLAASGEGLPHEFYGVQDARRLADGSIAVALRGEIRFYAADGTFLETVGSEGEGPGEFARLVRIDPFRDDSLLAFDPRNRRLTILGPARAIGRIVPLPNLPFTLDLVPLGPDVLLAGVRSGGDFVESDDVGHVRAAQHVVRVSPAGAVLDTVATVRGAEAVRIQETGLVADARPLFGQDTHLDARGGRFYAGDSETLSFRIHAADGTLERIVRAHADLVLTEEDARAEREIRLDFFDDSPAARRLLEVTPDPPTRPAYADLLVDSEGAVWLPEHRGWFRNLLDLAPRRWEIFGTDGAWLGPVELPGRFTVYEIGPDYLLGLRRDDLDLERVQLLPLRR